MMTTDRIVKVFLSAENTQKVRTLKGADRSHTKYTLPICSCSFVSATLVVPDSAAYPQRRYGVQ